MPIKKDLSAINHNSYRPEIDGLRAIAVLLVVLFHAFPNKLTGGFVGVDVFFVISGYLITSIILKEIESNKFTIIGFYKKRINRIYPALIFVLLISIVVSKVILFKAEIEDFNLSVFFSTIFLANIFFSRTLNYFDNTADDHPLLHLWSLGVEEQFYILWPLLLIFIAPRKFAFSIKVISYILAFSFVLNVYFVSKYQSDVFYLPFTRLWELGFGSLCAFASLNGIKNRLNPKFSLLSTADLFVLFGLLIIISSAITIKTTNAFPGWFALFPVVGSGLVLVYGKFSRFASTVLANKVLVFLGLISYPLYLWHWPILAFGHIHFGYLMDKNIKLILLLVSLLLATITYYFIENPIRYKINNSRKSAYLFLALLCLGLYSLYSYNSLKISNKTQNDTFVSDYKDYVALNQWTVKNRTYCGYIDYKGVFVENLPKECVQVNLKKSIMLWGDSHAFQLYYGLNEQLGYRFQLNQLTSSGCRPFIGISQNGDSINCQRSNEYAISKIKQAKPDTIIIAQKDMHDKTDWSQLSGQLKKIGVKRVILVGPVPQWNQNLYRYIAKNYNDISLAPQFINSKVQNKDIIQLDKYLKNKYKNDASIEYISLIDLLCTESQGCMAFIKGSDGEELTTFDYGHLGLKTSSFVSKFIADIVSK